MIFYSYIQVICLFNPALTAFEYMYNSSDKAWKTDFLREFLSIRMQYLLIKKSNYNIFIAKVYELFLIKICKEMYGKGLWNAG